MILNKRKINTLKELEDFLHKSNVVFPLLSEWKTKFKPKIRKVDDRTKWAIFRFQMYISIRFLQFFNQILDLIKDEDVSKPSFSVTKVRGKLLMITKYIKKNKVFTKTVKITARTKTLLVLIFQSIRLNMQKKHIQNMISTLYQILIFQRMGLLIQ